MRKSLVLLLALLLVVSIAICACKKDEAPVDSETQNAGGETTTEEVTTTEETEEPKPALRPITADTYNVVEGDWTMRY